MSSQITKRQRTILTLLIALGSPTLVAQRLLISQPAVTKTSKILQDRGLLKIIPRNSTSNEYNLTSDGYLEVHGIVKEAMQYRWRHHKLGIEFYVRPSFLNVWKKRRNKITSLKVRLQNNTQEHFKLKNIPAKTTTKGVIIYPEDIFGKDHYHLGEQMIELIEKAGYAINNHFKAPIFKEGLTDVEIISQELAYMEDPLAQEFINQKQRMILSLCPNCNEEALFCEGCKRKGHRRLVIDFSKVEGTPTPETEGVHQKEAPEDMHNWKKMSQAVITGKFKAEEVLKRLQDLEAISMQTTTVLEGKKPQPKQPTLKDYLPNYIG